MTLIDANVLLDVAKNDPGWADWSIRQLEMAATRGRLVITDIVYAELSVRFERIEDIDRFLGVGGIAVEPTPRAALFLAGKVFRRYRDRGGVRTGVLPDFLIGAHAAVAGLALLTRDAGRYRTYYPTLTLITPTA